MTVDNDLETWGGGNWTLTINGTDYSNAFQKAQFQESLNEPVHWQIETQGIDANNTDVSKGNIVKLSYDGQKAFKGRIRNSKVSSDLKGELEGLGMAFDLLRRTFTKNYSGSNTDTVVSEVVGTTMNIGTNTRLNSTNNTVDFRMDEESKLGGINRLVGDYGGEWWVDEDSNGNDQLNVDTKRGGGSSVKTFRTSGNQKNAAVAEKNTSAGEGDYDGVVVKGYGDGDDQVKATAGATGDEDEVLVYTDKTILSDSQAQKKADELKTLRVDGNWTEITIVPGDPNELLEIGDVVTVDSADADISSTDYRIVERNYNIDFQGQLEAELVCNNRPATVFDGGLAKTREQTKSQTEYMQGNRNTINESNADVADKNEGTSLEFNIPQRFTQDVTGKERTAAVYLDLSVDNYKQLLNASDVTTIDDQTKVVDTTVNNFGDVETAITDKETFATSDMTIQDALGIENLVEGGRTNSIGYTISSEGTFETGDSFTTGSSDIQGIYVTISVISNNDNRYTIPEPSDKTSLYREIVDIDGDGNNEEVATYTNVDSNTDLIEGAILGADPDDNTVEFLVPGEAADGGNYKTELISFYARVEDANGNVFFYPNDGSGQGLDIRSWAKMGAQGEIITDFNLFIPGNFKSSTVDLKFTNLSVGVSGNTDGESFTGYYTYYTIDKVRTPNAQDGNENVSAYVAKNGSNFDASVNADQGTESLPNTSTTTFGKLDSNDLVLTKKNTTADQVRVYLNGTEIDNSPISLSTGPPYTVEDIELTGDANASLNKPGFNSLEIVPENSADSTDDATSYVKGNVVVDHKIDSERS